MMTYRLLQPNPYDQSDFVGTARGSWNDAAVDELFASPDDALTAVRALVQNLGAELDTPYAVRECDANGNDIGSVIVIYRPDSWRPDQFWSNN